MTDEITTEVQCLVDKALGGDAEARLKKKCYEITDDIYGYIEYQLKDDLAGNLAALVQRMADNAIEALLAGDEQRMRAYLKCTNYYTGREDMDRLIVNGGKLYEYGPVILRRKIVDAFPDLLKNERILDLEAQVAALVKVNVRVSDERDRARRGYQD